MLNLKNGLELLSHGGFMMIPLVIAATVALAVALERIYALDFIFRTPSELISRLFDLIQAKKIDEALALARSQKTPVTDVLAAGLEHLEDPASEMELVMKNRAEDWIPRLEKRIEVIDTVITAAPLMGLLGTITGMMASFQVLSEKGVNEPGAITGGVAEALIATATGLVIALTCLFFFNYLSARVKTFIHQLESVGARLTELRLAHEKKN